MSSLDYKLLFQRAEEIGQLKQEKTQLEQKTHSSRRKPRSWNFSEPAMNCYPVSTKGAIPPPQGKYCPTNLVRWEECAHLQQEIFDSMMVFSLGTIPTV